MLVQYIISSLEGHTLGPNWNGEPSLAPAPALPPRGKQSHDVGCAVHHVAVFSVQCTLHTAHDNIAMRGRGAISEREGLSSVIGAVMLCDVGSLRAPSQL